MSNGDRVPSPSEIESRLRTQVFLPYVGTGAVEMSATLEEIVGDGLAVPGLVAYVNSAFFPNGGGFSSLRGSMTGEDLVVEIRNKLARS